MNIDEYNDWVEGKIITKGQARLVENVLGLVGEAGEVAEKIKKLLRDDAKFTPEDIAKELGDVLFYVTAVGNYMCVPLSEIMDLNVRKLDDREDRGVLQGSGDDR